MGEKSGVGVEGESPVGGLTVSVERLTLNEMVVVGDASVDPLHSCHQPSGDKFIRDGVGRAFPSVEHYCHYETMLRLNLAHKADQILSLEAEKTFDRTNRIVRDHLPADFGPVDLLVGYLVSSREHFTKEGLEKFMAKNDDFRTELLSTDEAMIVACQGNDRDMGIGTDQATFLKWAQINEVTADLLYDWLMRPEHRPPNVPVGGNKLGLILMDLRENLRKEQQQSKLLRTSHIYGSLSVSDQLLALSGPFLPLSNFYALQFSVGDKKYRSVEHFAYVQLCEKLKLPDKLKEKIRTTSESVKVSSVFAKMSSKKANEKLFSGLTTKKWLKLERKMTKWRKKAMRFKILKNDFLKRLLLTTGDSVLVETNFYELDDKWTAATDEAELQHLLTKKYITPPTLLEWMGNFKNSFVLPFVYSTYQSQIRCLTKDFELYTWSTFSTEDV